MKLVNEMMSKEWMQAPNYHIWFLHDVLFSLVSVCPKLIFNYAKELYCQVHGRLGLPTAFPVKSSIRIISILLRRPPISTIFLV